MFSIINNRLHIYCLKVFLFLCHSLIILVHWTDLILSLSTDFGTWSPKDAEHLLQRNIEKTTFNTMTDLKTNNYSDHGASLLKWKLLTKNIFIFISLAIIIHPAFLFENFIKVIERQRRIVNFVYFFYRRQ